MKNRISKSSLLNTLTYLSRYSNSSLYNPEDFFSLSRGREVTAENLEAEAVALQTRVSILQTRVSILLKQAYEYRSKRYSEDASLLYKEAASLEEEATRLLNMATDLRRQAEFKYEAEAVFEEDRYISKWEEIYDMM